MACLGWRRQYVEDAYEVDVVILGHRNYSIGDLCEIVSRRRESSLKVYSQEMMFAYIATGVDPLDGSRRDLEMFAEGHAGLTELSKGIALDDGDQGIGDTTEVSRGITVEQCVVGRVAMPEVD